MLKRRPLYYEMETSEQEVYQTETYYFLQVVDLTGRVWKHLEKQNQYESMEEFMEKLFEAQKDHKLYKVLKENIDYSKFNVTLYLLREGARDHKAIVKITKLTLCEKIKKRFRVRI